MYVWLVAMVGGVLVYVVANTKAQAKAKAEEEFGGTAEQAVKQYLAR